MWNQNVFSWCISYCEMQVYFPVKTGGFRGGRGRHSPISFSDQNVKKKTHKLVVYYSKSVFVTIHPSYNKSRITTLIALKSYFLKTQNLEVSSGFAPWAPIRVFCPGPTGGIRVAQYLQRFGPPFNKFWIRHCKDFTYLITVSYCCCLPLNSVLHIHTFLSLPSPVSFKALLRIQNFLSLPSPVLKHCYIYKISSLYRALYHLQQCYM